MRLSMWILADWLEKYHPIISIRNGEPVLRSARIFSPDARIEPQNVYLALAKEFISSQRNKILCVHGCDMLLLDTTDIDEVLNDILNAFDYYNSWSDGSMKDIADGCGLQHLVDWSYDIFREPMVVFDAGLTVIAYTTQYGPDDVNAEWKALVQPRESSFDMKDSHPSKYRRKVQELNFPFFNVRSLQKILFREKTVIGRIILLEFHRREGKGTMQLLDALGSLIELWMDRAREEQLMSDECDIFRDLLDGKQVPVKELNHKLSTRGWEERQEKLLLKLDIPATYAYPLLSKLEQALGYIRNILRTMVDQSAVHPALHILKRNDEENQNDLYKTLCVSISRKTATWPIRPER